MEKTKPSVTNTGLLVFKEMMGFFTMGESESRRNMHEISHGFSQIYKDNRSLSDISPTFQMNSDN